MEYINTVQAAKKWNISTTRVTILANEGRIEGAVQLGNRWLIPNDTEKPADRRTKQARDSKKVTPPFRYFLSDFKPIGAFDSPLTDEEVRIRAANLAFQACDFNEAEKQLGNIHLTSENIYNRIYSLFATCLIDIMVGRISDFHYYYEKLYSELLKHFPRQKEMSFLPHELACILGATEYYINDFKIDPTYKYHDSFSSHLAYMSVLSFMYSSKSFDEHNVSPYELLCGFVDKTDNLVDAQTIHFDLGIIYSLMNKTEEMTLHIKKGLEIGISNKLYWVPSLMFLYYRNIIEPVLKTFPNEYCNLITSFSEDIGRRFSEFMGQASNDSFFKSLLSNKFIYVFYALHGYSSKEVAEIMGTTESSVNNTYSKIYSSLNVLSKKEMVEYYLRSNANSLFNKK